MNDVNFLRSIGTRRTHKLRK